MVGVMTAYAQLIVPELIVKSSMIYVQAILANMMEFVNQLSVVHTHVHANNHTQEPTVNLYGKILVLKMF